MIHKPKPKNSPFNDEQDLRHLAANFGPDGGMARRRYTDLNGVIGQEGGEDLKILQG